MILMNAILAFSAKHRRAAHLLGTTITFDNQDVAGEQSPAFQFLGCYLEETRVVYKNSIPLNVCHREISNRIYARSTVRPLLDAASYFGDYLDWLSLVELLKQLCGTCTHERL